MGPGGITAIVVKVAEQKAFYVVIDGNNMILDCGRNPLSLPRLGSTKARFSQRTRTP